MLTVKIKENILRFLNLNSSNGKIQFFISYVHNRRRLPNFKNPKDLSEIWIKRVLDGKVNDVSYLADKHEVRGWIKSKGLGHILVKELGVYEKGDDINFEVLPNRFALKANFGAGRNIICTDKSKLDTDAVRRQVDTWLKPGRYSNAERHYDLIPRKFICEEFIDDGTGGFPIDYKFLCINGKVHCILACSGREKGHADYLPYSVDWKPLLHYFKSVPADIEVLNPPTNLKDMINVSEYLAKEIDLVRIDLYSNGEKIWFGEITLTPSGCIFHRWSNKAVDDMGELYRTTKNKI